MFSLLGNWQISDWSFTELTAFHYTVVTCACLSILGTLLMILSYSLSPKLHCSHLRLVFVLAIADLGLALSYVLALVLPFAGSPGSPGQGKVCMVQAIGIQYFELASSLWTTTIAWHSYCVIVKNQEDILGKHWKWVMAGCWGLPLISVCVMVGVMGVGATEDMGLWCYGPTYNWIIVRLLLMHLPAIILWIFSLVCYIMIRHKVSSLMSRMEAPLNSRITGYVIVFLLAEFFPAINLFCIIFIGKIFYLCMLNAVSAVSLGFFNFLVYGITNMKMRKMLCCQCSREADELTVATVNFRGSDTEEPAKTRGF